MIRNKINRTVATALLSALLPLSAGAADIKIAGRVIDGSTGEGLAGARVTLLNGESAAMAGDGGDFSISIPDNGSVLRVEIPGYDVRYIPVAKGSIGNIVLQPTSGYGYATAGSEGAFTNNSMSFFPIEEINADQSVADLQGNLYAISRSGVPGAGSTVYINGLHSINTSSQPLYVVDGVIWGEAPETSSVIDGNFSNPLSLIDPRDIAKITVLKNGSMIYGAKAAGGVVLIDTRRAKDAATKIEAFAMLGVRTPGKHMPVMDARQYRTYITDVLRGRYSNSSFLNNLSFLNDDPSAPGYWGSHNDTDWQGELMHDAIMMNYGINVRGGDDRALYAFSLGYAKADGNVKETSYDRLNVRFNSDINLWAGFKLRFDVAFAQASRKLRNDGIDRVSSPYYMSMIKSPLFNIFERTATGGVTNNYTNVDELGVGNPFSVLELGIGNNRNYRFNLNALPRYEFNNRLALQARVSYTFDKNKENSFLPDFGVEDTYLYTNNGEIYATSRNVVKSQMGRYTALEIDGHVEYSPLKNLDQTLDLQLGYRYSNDTYNYSYGEGHNTSSDYMTDLSNTSSSLHWSHGLDSQWRNVSWYLTAAYNWQERYFLSADAVIESSSRFGKHAPGALHLGGVSWGFFPSVNAAWVISNEDFLRHACWLSLLKLSASFSMTGNDKVPVYANSTYYGSTKFLDNAFGWALENIGNDRIKWETTRTWRVGLDMSFFNDRWSLGADFYRSTTDDLLMRRALPDEAGQAYYWTNDGALRNIGFNVSTSVRALNLRDWKLDVGATLGHYHNKVTRLADSFTTDVMGGQILTEVGGPIGQFYGYRTDGVYSTAAEASSAHLAIVNNDGSRTPFEAGDMRFVDLNKDGIINDKDRTVIGNPNPDIYGNFNFRLSWKNLSLSTLFTYSVGNDVYNALRANLESGSSELNQTVAMMNRWVASGQQTDIPRATYGDPMGNARFSDRWIEDGSYLKWKSLEVSYNIPIRSSFLQGVTVSAAMHNLLTFTKYLGPDPEFSYGTSPLFMGVDGGLTAPGREFCFGVKINL